MKSVKPPQKIKRLLSIDPSSHSIAFAVMDEGKLVAKGKVDFTKGCTTHDRMKVIAASMPALISHHSIDYVLIEESIWIQNPNTSRTLAYIVGGIWSQVASSRALGGHVGPLQWKRELGYETVKQKEIKAWAELYGPNDAKKIAAWERKMRVRRIVEPRIPNLYEPDGDIMDAIAIGMWGSEHKETL